MWSDRTINGTLYTFGHLRAYDVEVTKPARGELPELKYTVRVIFECHVVTEDHLEMRTGPEFWLDNAGRCRAFDLVRYQRSLELPALIRSLIDGLTFCYGAKYNNYMYWDPPSANPGDPPYLFFFDLKVSSREPNLITMNVKSAYTKDQPQTMTKENRKVFAKLCAELLGAVPKKTKNR